MDANDQLATAFEATRPHLRAVAYRMLGSLSDADDAVQEAWLRLSRSDAAAIDNLGGWLTTVVGRVCLDMMRSRTARREQALFDDDQAGGGFHMPEPVIAAAGELDPEHEALLADSVGLAMLVVLQALDPAERLAFVLHDMFAVPFDEIAPIVGRSPAASRQLASRARRRVQGAPAPDADLSEQWRVVDAYLAASRDGDFEGLLAVLDPDVVLRVDGGVLAANVSGETRGAHEVVRRALAYSRLGRQPRLALVNGAPGLVTVEGDTRHSVLGFTIRGGRVVEIDILADPERLAQLDLSMLD